MPNKAESWSLTSLREKLIKVGAKVVSHMAATSPSDGRGRGVAADVRGDPAADRSAADTACLGMTGFGSTGTDDGREGAS
jgi:hypothetical protein